MAILRICVLVKRVVFFFNDTATTEIYTLSLHDALPISGAGKRAKATVPWTRRPFPGASRARMGKARGITEVLVVDDDPVTDRKSTRLNSSHANISYAVFCLKKKKAHTDFVGGQSGYVQG